MPALPRFRAVYRSLTNALVFVLGLFVFFAAVDWLWFADRRDKPGVLQKYGIAAMRNVYPDLDDDGIETLLRETWQRQLYEPFIQNRERARSGRFVNVADPGYRLVEDQGPWPPRSDALNVFVFGGSTTFGYGVRDAETVVSCLQKALRERRGSDVFAYNFGAGFHRSTQERAFFETLLLDGHVPDVAIFIDGLNDFAFPSGPALTSLIAGLLETGRQVTFGDVLRQTALVRAAARVTRELELSAAKADSAAPVAGDDRETIDAVIKRYFDNKRMIEAIAQAHAVRVAFVWQPVPTYGYDRAHHPFAGDDFGVNRLSVAGYPAMRAHVDAHEPQHFIWAAEMQRGLEEPLYVDNVHYGPKLSRLLAQKIVEEVLRLGLLPGPDEKR